MARRFVVTHPLDARARYPRDGRRVWKMTDRAQEELTRAIVHDAVRKYIATRRERIDLFVDRHFTLAGSLELHRRAIGWDLLRAPANLGVSDRSRRQSCHPTGARRAVLPPSTGSRQVSW